MVFKSHCLRFLVLAKSNSMSHSRVGSKILNFTIKLEIQNDIGLIRCKNGKQAARFEVVSSTGLPAESLTGLIGEAMTPKDYIIDPEGNIYVGDNVISSSTIKYMEHDKCHFIPQEDIHLFYKKELSGICLKISPVNQSPSLFSSANETNSEILHTCII